MHTRLAVPAFAPNTVRPTSSRMRSLPCPSHSGCPTVCLTALTAQRQALSGAAEAGAASAELQPLLTVVRRMQAALLQQSRPQHCVPGAPPRRTGGRLGSSRKEGPACGWQQNSGWLSLLLAVSVTVLRFASLGALSVCHL
jgi:hypothetical protein